MESHGLPKIIAVIGPTASGKTALGVELALEYGGEIVSADAKQVYRGMDIGTAKEKDLPVAQHLIDIKDPGEQITVAEYQGLAYEVINSLLNQQILPILVGGSGLYAESVLNGYIFSPGKKSRAQEPRYESLKLGLAWERQDLVERAELRLQQRLEMGLVEEVRRLLEQGVDPQWLWNCGIEYRYVSLYCRGELTYEEMVVKVSIATRQFIKRQYTWWRRHADIHWVRGIEEAEMLVDKFLKY